MKAVAVVIPALVVTSGLLYTGKRFLLQLGGVHEVTSDATPFVTPVAVAVGNGTVWLVLTLPTVPLLLVPLPVAVVFTVCVCAAAVAA
jgi:hypothetical protein